MKQGLFALLLALQALDVATTLYGIQLGAHEDPRTFMAKVFRLTGESWYVALAVLKVAFVFLIAFLYNWLPTIALAGLCALFSYVCWHNWTVIKKLR